MNDYLLKVLLKECSFKDSGSKITCIFRGYIGKYERGDFYSTEEIKIMAMKVAIANYIISEKSEVFSE
jgi:hypothetical protein